MRTIDEIKEELFAAIRGGEVYQRFEKAKEAISGEDERKARIDAFRERAYLLSNVADPLERMDELEALFVERRQIRKDPLIDAYLTAEHAYCRMIQNLCGELLELSDVQIEAFEDKIIVN